MKSLFFKLHLNLGWKTGWIWVKNFFLVFIILKFPAPPFRKFCVRHWAYAKSFHGGLKFCRTVTPQIYIMESAEGKTIVGWSGGMLRKKFAKFIRVFVHSESKF